MSEIMNRLNAVDLDDILKQAITAAKAAAERDWITCVSTRRRLPRTC